MANHKSAKKSIRQIQKRADVNKARKSRVKTYIKKVLEAIASGKNDDARKVLSEVQSEIDRGVTKGIFKKNTASRRISRLAARVKAMAA
ncbi:30S ribosomal protein S20 [Rickettsiales endosymbiont of Stachyamoeba lipophora]|uniref:30S ribosomal protein S20 n=1 Tax=Rickettsiales endosymbiont of Stachyamoeba lipophora TaxID=2486578 RepID=UPI000F648951|nr:30S ribosomal protein S20 [Rickettsiales endosymbiont of Stachyamoeba lipophora]AZL15346.1 30S ribosomal protein S20 [Rickettsiales endosymbiont of Stachyamoeba lipophora]